MRFLVVALALIISAPAMAEVTLTFPVSIPQECVELAQREHVPILITDRYEATKAKIKLYRLSNSDPMVLGCKQAVQAIRRLKAAKQNQRPKAAMQDQEALTSRTRK